MLDMFWEFVFFILRIIFSSICGLFVISDKDLEIAILRKENLILKRKRGKPRIMSLDRFFYLFIYKHYRIFMDKIMLVKPATVISWQGMLVKRKWSFNKRKVGRPPVTDDIKKQIIAMKQANNGRA